MRCEDISDQIAVVAVQLPRDRPAVVLLVITLAFPEHDPDGLHLLGLHPSHVPVHVSGTAERGGGERLTVRESAEHCPPTLGHGVQGRPPDERDHILFRQSQCEQTAGKR
jgi:hypothetical protein